MFFLEKESIVQKCVQGCVVNISTYRKCKLNINIFCPRYLLYITIRIYILYFSSVLPILNLWVIFKEAILVGCPQYEMLVYPRFSLPLSLSGGLLIPLSQIFICILVLHLVTTIVICSHNRYNFILHGER